jgi:hypothetical protein
MSIFPPTPLVLQMQCDATPLTAALDELTKLSINAPDGFVKGLLRVADSFVDLVCLDQDLPAAAGADNLTVTLKPSVLLERLLATARTGDFDLTAFGHDSISVFSNPPPVPPWRKLRLHRPD